MSKSRNLADLLNASGQVTAEDLDVGQIGGRRNLIINGAMQVAQRGTSFTGLTNGSGGYKLDRWAWYENDAPSYVMTVSQSTDAPDNFKNSLKVETTTAEATLATGDLCRLRYSLEGQDMTQFGWGTSSAKQVTLSFWVKSNKTGTYVWYWNHYAGTSQTTSKTFTVDSSGVWEYKTITFAASGTAPSVTNNTLGSYLELIFVGGTTFTSGTANLDWADTNSNNRAAGLDVNLADTVGNYLAITGVQLEVGSVATPFEHRSFGEELALCRRYFYTVGYPDSINQGLSGKNFATAYVLLTNRPEAGIPLPTTMRAIPSFSQVSGTGYFYVYTSGVVAFNAWSGVNAPTEDFQIIYVSGVSGSAGYATVAGWQNNAARLFFDAEL